MENSTDNKEVKAPELKAEVAAKYQLAGIQHAGQVRYKGKMIDLAKIGLKEAEDLAKDEKFPYLVEKKAAGSSSSSQPPVK